MVFMGEHLPNSVKTTPQKIALILHLKREKLSEKKTVLFPFSLFHLPKFYLGDVNDFRDCGKFFSLRSLSSGTTIVMSTLFHR